MSKFSFKEYKKIVEYYKKNLKPKMFDEVKKNSTNFFILRHDVEFSVERAYKLAKFEKQILKIKSSYFFQLRNNAYNILSIENKRKIHKIKKMGHKIGLHFNYKGPADKKKINSELLEQNFIFQKEFNSNYCFFSPHRPSLNQYLLKVSLPKLINTYNPLYFTDFSDAKKNPTKTIYLADSRHTWKYLHPIKLDLIKHRKVQLVFHPDAWTIKGYNKSKNYNKLRDENYTEFNQTLYTETNYLKK